MRKQEEYDLSLERCHANGNRHNALQLLHPP